VKKEDDMKVLLAGASGALGTPITRQLIAHGHDVLALARNPANRDTLARAGTTPVIADALDRDGLLRAVDGLSADAVIHELTALRKPPLRSRGMAQTNRLRIDGTANLLAAARVLGARRFLTQSIILGYGFTDHGDTVLTEDAPFGRTDVGANADAVGAMRSTEQQAFTAPEGIALRYGMLYGGDAQAIRALLAKRAIPVVDGGYLGMLHHEDAAAATVAALERGRAGEAYNLVDDLPATWRDVFTAIAAALRTPKPITLPRWMFRLVAPYVASVVLDTSMRVSNAKAKTELDWHPVFPSFRDGVRAMATEAEARPSRPRRIA
jgi:nucleoside-diphosphate-sugar epimerase